MKIILTFIISLFLLTLSSPKLVRKYYTRKDFTIQQQTFFLTKFDIGQAGGSIKIITMHRQILLSTNRKLNFSIIKDTELQKYLAQPCRQYRQKPQMTANLRPGETANEQKFSIHSLDREHIFYLYLENCNNSMKEVVQADSEELSLEITLLNQGSHFGEDQNTLWGYVLLVVVWVGMMVHFFKTIGDVFLYSQDQAKITAFVGLIVIGIAYFYRLLHLILYNINGQGLYFFQYLYHILKSSCEFVVVTFISAIGWGWSITHLKHDQSYILAGVTVAIINIIGMCVSVSAEQMVDTHHKYDSTAGYILQILRILIALIFIIGVLRTLSLSVGNSRRFIMKFSFIGGVYLTSWPAVVLFSQLFLPNYMHNEVITFVGEITHMIASALLCQVLSNPESTYRKISMKEEDNPLKMTNYKHK